MGKKMQGSNSTGPTKAGKKHQFKAPNPVNLEKRDRKLAGEQQFVRDSNARIDRLPTNGVFDGLVRAFGLKVRGGQNIDTGLRWDENRKRVVVPHGQLTNGY